MSTPRILLEISETGIGETGILAQTTAESEAAHALLAKVAFELRHLNEALKRPATEEAFWEPEPSADPVDADFTAAAEKLVRALGSEHSDGVKVLLGLCEYKGGFVSSDLKNLPKKDLGFLLSSNLITWAKQGGFRLNVVVNKERRKGPLVKWAGVGD